MNPIKRYLQIRNEFGWACKIADEFGWAWSDYLVALDLEIEKQRNEWLKKILDDNRQHLIKTEREFIDEFLSSEENAKWARKKRIEYLEQYNPKSVELKMLKENKIIRRITDEMIEKARQFPIPQMLGDSKNNKYNCIWHDDKNPSMHYYEKSNSVYCFSCGASGDAIDVAKKLYNLTFKEAVKKLN